MLPWPRTPLCPGLSYVTMMVALARSVFSDADRNSSQIADRNKPMNINDPFGRIQDKHQRNYESLCHSLQKAGVTTRADAEALLVKLRKRGIWGTVVTVLVTLLLVGVLPDLRILVVVCGALLFFWFSKTSLNGQEYVKRYIREELEESDEVPPS